jgi:hypothetical protein
MKMRKWLDEQPAIAFILRESLYYSSITTVVITVMDALRRHSAFSWPKVIDTFVSGFLVVSLLSTFQVWRDARR